jgi:flagellar hook-length control protein FliK
LPAAIAAQQLNTALIATPQGAVPLNALAVHIARKFEQGSSEFEIRLHPADLGKLDITLSVAEDGRVQANLRAERPETLELLQRDVRNLEQQLRHAGLDVGSNALSFSLSNGQNQRQAPNPIWPEFAGANDAASQAQDYAIANYLAVPVRDGIDIRV